MAEQRYTLDAPCFRVRQLNKVRDWYCDKCGELRRAHTILIIEDRRDDWQVADRVIAICPDGSAHGPAWVLLQIRPETLLTGD